MIKSKVIKQIDDKLSKLGMPYYSNKKTTWSHGGKNCTKLFIEFCIPYHSLRNLMIFCEINNFGLAVDNGKVEMNLYEISKIKNIFGVAKDDLY